MDAQQFYRQQSIETASPAQLVSMLYHGAIGAIARAEGHLAQQGHEAANRDLQKAQAIVQELQVTLDFERGGSIARNLHSLYTFCTEQLIEGNLRKDPQPLADARDVLVGLAEAWDQMAAQLPETGAVAVGAGAPYVTAG